MNSLDAPEGDQYLDDSPAALWHRIAWFKGDLPAADIQQALQIPEQFVPLILNTIEEFLTQPTTFTEPEEFSGPPLGLLLLAKLREPRGFPLAIRLLHLDAATLDGCMGDMLTETVPAILASTFDGNLDALKRLYENPKLDEYVRIAGLSAMATLVSNDLLPERELRTYIGELLQRLPREPGFVWDMLITIASDFRFTEYREEILKLYDDGIADPQFDDKTDVADRFYEEVEEPRPWRYRLVNDVIRECAWWSHAEAPTPFLTIPTKQTIDPFASYAHNQWTEDADETYVRESAKVGRNDACPCGSGRKFKKCCIP